ncbi:hypothetical protein Halar_2660 [halophilic archaeon DL31]|jgi:hypothetical protein|nr:hypothetical protein Halar_2660 [halophilic archaeon DL31]
MRSRNCSAAAISDATCSRWHTGFLGFVVKVLYVARANLLGELVGDVVCIDARGHRTRADSSITKQGIYNGARRIPWGLTPWMKPTLDEPNH